MFFPLSGLKHSSLQYTVGPSRCCAPIPRHSCTWVGSVRYYPFETIKNTCFLLFYVNEFAYRANHSEDITVNLNLQHLRTPGIHVRAQFVDFSSALNMSFPGLHNKPLLLPALCPICKSIMAFLTNRKQQVWLGSNLSVPLKAYLSSILAPFHTVN